MKQRGSIYNAEYVVSKLAQTYKLYFPFDEIKPLKQYFQGVETAHDGSGIPFYETRVELDPLRIVIKNLSTMEDRVAWQLTGSYQLNLNS